LCTPSLAVDIILAVDGPDPDDIYLVRRVDTGSLATTGGFVEVGESAETAAVREIHEETGVAVAEKDLKLVGFYSDPRRDLRRHSASVAYSVTIPADAHLRAGDDARGIVHASLKDTIEKDSILMFADHKIILKDYARIVGVDVAQHIPHGIQNIKKSVCVDE